MPLRKRPAGAWRASVVSPASTVNPKRPHGAALRRRVPGVPGGIMPPITTRRAIARRSALVPARRGYVALQVHQIDREPRRDVEDALVAIELAVDDAPNARVGDLLEAVPAGAGGDVNHSAVDEDAVLGGLDDGVGLGVDRGHAVVVLHHVPAGVR